MSEIVSATDTGRIVRGRNELRRQAGSPAVPGAGYRRRGRRNPVHPELLPEVTLEVTEFSVLLGTAAITNPATAVPLPPRKWCAWGEKGNCADRQRDAARAPRPASCSAGIAAMRRGQSQRRHGVRDLPPAASRANPGIRFSGRHPSRVYAREPGNGERNLRAWRQEPCRTDLISDLV